MKNLAFVLILALFGACQDSVSFKNIEDSVINRDLSKLNGAEMAKAKELMSNDLNLVSTSEINERLKNENLNIIATIPRGAYNLGFIKGAKHFEFSVEFSGVWESDTKETKDRFKEFLGEGEVVFYDNGEGSAISAIKWAKNLGYENVYYLAGSWRAWKERGFEISFEVPECCQM